MSGAISLLKPRSLEGFRDLGLDLDPGLYIQTKTQRESERERERAQKGKQAWELYIGHS